MGCWRHDSMDY